MMGSEQELFATVRDRFGVVRRVAVEDDGFRGVITSGEGRMGFWLPFEAVIVVGTDSDAAPPLGTLSLPEDDGGATFALPDGFVPEEDPDGEDEEPTFPDDYEDDVADAERSLAALDLPQAGRFADGPDLLDD